MIVYTNSAKGFRDDVDNNQIVHVLEEKFIKTIGHRESPSEKSAWRNSLGAMERIVRRSQIPNDCGIMIEYVIPNTNNRVDFIVTGKNDEGLDHYVVVELKQWEKAIATDKPNLVNTFIGGHHIDVNHPSYQAESYNRMMKLMNESIYTTAISGYACAYLHNYEKQNPEPLLDDRYQDIVNESPVFFSGDTAELEAFMRKMVGKGSGMEIMYQIENGRIRPSKKLVDCLDELYKGNDDFVLIDEQNVAYSTIVHELNSLKKKKTIIVKGGPGTGKSVISFKVLHAMIDKRLNAKFIAPNEAFREVMKRKLKASKADKANVIDMLFGGSSIFFEVPKNYYDVLICDEAHRLKRKGAYMYNGENQVYDIIHASILNVFFVDDSQQVRPDDIGSVAEIKRVAEQEGSEICELELKAQFRCAGAEGFVNWVTHTLQIADTGNYDNWGDQSYDFKIFDDPNEMFEAIKEKNKSSGIARMAAGFAWEWSADKYAKVDDVTIPECDFKAPWNRRDKRALFAVKDDSVNEIGCIHTLQGLELDYIGVIIGNDLKYDTENKELYCDFSEYKDSNGKKGLKGNPKQVLAYVKNIYRVLLTRGMKGCYLFCRNKDLQDYFRSRLP